MGTSTCKEVAEKSVIEDVRQEIGNVHQEIADFRAEMRANLKALELRLTVRLTGAMIVTAGLMIAILKPFP